MKTHYLKVRLDAAHAQTLKSEADALGMTVSEHVRLLLGRARHALDQAQFLGKLDDKLAAFPDAAAPPPGGTDHEPAHAEVLLLLREIAADRNAQILSRVTQQLNARYPDRKKS